MEKSTNTAQFFDVVVAKKYGDQLHFSKNAGFAILNEQNGYYIIRLNIFPKNCYFLVKNFSENRRYTVFSKILHSEEGVKFQRPVGSGQLIDSLKTHLEIRFIMPKMVFYMSLFPKYQESIR